MAKEKIAIAVIIPFFRRNPIWYEEQSINQAIKVLHEYDHVLIVPKGLDTSAVESWYQLQNKPVIIKKFEACFFESTATYNKLMLSAGFYKSFEVYSFLLIYQTDAWIFRDELKYWIGKNYDYVGAPWIDWPHTSPHKKELSIFDKLLWFLGKRRFDAVGNGGLSLRKTTTAISMLEYYKEQASTYPYNEDYFFSFFIRKHNRKYRVAPVQEALTFSFDEYPHKALKMAKDELPMACHGWPKHYEFWKKFIVLPDRKLGVESKYL